MVLLLQAAITVAYLVVFGRACAMNHRRRKTAEASMRRWTGVRPAADRAPAGAVGWPPDGAAFSAYVESGLAAIDAYLAERFAS